MSDPAIKNTKKASKEKKEKTKKAPIHPKYSDMISDAIQTLKERTGSSRQSIVKFTAETYQIEEKVANTQVKSALKRGVESGSLKQVKGVGASGSFKLSKGEACKPKKATVKKTKAGVKKLTKKSLEKKAANKKSLGKTPKKSAKKPTVAKKSSAKKPKATKKSPTKKPTKKSATHKKPSAKEIKK